MKMFHTAWICPWRRVVYTHVYIFSRFQVNTLISFMHNLRYLFSSFRHCACSIIYLMLLEPKAESRQFGRELLSVITSTVDRLRTGIFLREAGYVKSNLRRKESKEMNKTALPGINLTVWGMPLVTFDCLVHNYSESIVYPLHCSNFRVLASSRFKTYRLFVWFSDDSHATSATLSFLGSVLFYSVKH